MVLCYKNSLTPRDAYYVIDPHCNSAPDASFTLWPPISLGLAPPVITSPCPVVPPNFISVPWSQFQHPRLSTRTFFIFIYKLGTFKCKQVSSSVATLVMKLQVNLYMMKIKVTLGSHLVIVAPIAVNSPAYMPSSHIFFFLRQERSLCNILLPFYVLTNTFSFNILSRFVHLM